MSSPLFSFREDIFLQVFLLVMKAWKNKTHLYTTLSEASAPQNVFCPEAFKGEGRGSLSHIRWLATAAMSDSRTQSRTLYKGMKSLWDTHPFLFESNDPCNTETLTALFREKGIGVPTVAVARFLTRRDSLWRHFGGSPLTFFGGKTVSLVLESMKKSGAGNPFPGVGPKIVSLLTVFLTEIDAFKKWGIESPEDFVPVDVWLQSISLSTRSLVIHDGLVRSNVVEKTLRPAFSSLMKTEGVCGSDVSHAFWLLGSKLCSSCSRVSTESLCPVYKECQGPIRRDTYWAGGLGGWKPVRFVKRPTQAVLF
jgi:hypothetical protein